MTAARERIPTGQDLRGLSQRREAIRARLAHRWHGHGRRHVGLVRTPRP